MITLNIKRLFTWGKGKEIASDILSSLGLFTVIITITSFFSALDLINTSLKTPYSLICISALSIFYSLFKNWPKTTYEYKLADKDIRIKMVIGDVFDELGAIVIPINSSFDVDLGGTVMSTGSIQAQVIKKFFESKMHGLQKSLNSRLTDPAPHKIGTTITIDKNGHKFYFLASSKKINNNHVETTKEMLTTALIGLWVYLSQHGIKGQIIIPLIGTGNAKISLARSDVFKEIIQSFIASCHEKTYCDILTVVISNTDVHNCNINIDELDEFLRFSCKHFNTHKTSTTPIGTPLE